MAQGGAGCNPQVPKPGLADPYEKASEHPENAAARLGRRGLAAFWLGVTTENMVEARRRIPVLLRVPARVHWLSVEPLLEPLDLRPWLGRGIDWIIVGGESGTKAARYMDPEWARDLRDQCQTARARFFFKQMTKRAPVPADLLVREYPA